MYWKKFTSVGMRNEPGVHAGLLKIAGRGQARESLEIIDEVRLVVVTARARQVRPIHFAPGMQVAEGTLKAVDACEAFGAQADSVAELVDKMFVTHPEIGGDIRHAWDFAITPQDLDGGKHRAIRQ